MSKCDLTVVVLAAGKGTRLKGPWAKPLCPALGKPLLGHLLGALEEFSESSGQTLQVSIVVGHRKSEIEEFIEHQKNQKKSTKLELSTVEQTIQNGTGGAVEAFFKQTPQQLHSEQTLIVCADSPCLSSDVFQTLKDAFDSNERDAVVASFNEPVPNRYGRIVRKKKGLEIVEASVANEDVLAITEVNSGVYWTKTQYLKEKLRGVEMNAFKKEFFLTDIFEAESNTEAIFFSESDSFLGVNDLKDLQTVEQVLLQRKVDSLFESGVYIAAPERFYCDWDVAVGEGSWIGPDVGLHGATEIGIRVKVEQGCILENATVGADSHLLPYTLVQDSSVGEQCQLGPFARIRPGTRLEKEVKIGNFVEVKKSVFDSGAKASHLSYIGDAHIGERSNLGCGFITCNYDGVQKHQTTIGRDCFIGSDCQMVAPVEVEDESFVAAGSTVTQSIPKQSFAIARSRQVTKEGLASRFKPRPQPKDQAPT